MFFVYRLESSGLRCSLGHITCVLGDSLNAPGHTTEVPGGVRDAPGWGRFAPVGGRGFPVAGIFGVGFFQWVEGVGCFGVWGSVFFRGSFVSFFPEVCL